MLTFPIQPAGRPFPDAERKQPWYALHTQGKFEKVASITLRAKGYEEFLPLYSVTRRWSDRKKALDLPLFPGYVFCRIDISKSLTPILASPGVLDIVRAGRTPLPVPEDELDAVKTVLRSGLAVTPWPGLEPGARVVVEQGPLSGLEGVVLDARKQRRLVISIAMLGRGVAVDVERDWVRPVSSTPPARQLPGVLCRQAEAVRARVR